MEDTRKAGWAWYFETVLRDEQDPLLGLNGEPVRPDNFDDHKTNGGKAGYYFVPGQAILNGQSEQWPKRPQPGADETEPHDPVDVLLAPLVYTYPSRHQKEKPGMVVPLWIPAHLCLISEGDAQSFKLVPPKNENWRPWCSRSRYLRQQ